MLAAIISLVHFNCDLVLWMRKGWGGRDGFSPNPGSADICRKIWDSVQQNHPSG